MRDPFDLPAPPDSPVPIGEAARRSGVPKDTLRIWERRYGFPAPGRDAAGDRAYPLDQVEKLRMIRLLVERGRRPSRLMGRSLTALQAEFQADGPPAARPDPWVTEALDLLRARDVESLRARLVATLHARGLRTFVEDNVAALSRAVGEAWVAGELEVFEEHLFTELVTRVLRSALEGVRPSGEARPGILLTTLPGEPHALGLLMAECAMTLAGARCLSLGVETPPADIVRAVAAHEADVVALSFSAMYPGPAARREIRDLRDALPPRSELWVGGGCPGLPGFACNGVRVLAELAQIDSAVTEWRSRSSIA